MWMLTTAVAINVLLHQPPPLWFQASDHILEPVPPKGVGWGWGLSSGKTISLYWSIKHPILICYRHENTHIFLEWHLLPRWKIKNIISNNCFKKFGWWTHCLWHHLKVHQCYLTHTIWSVSHKLHLKGAWLQTHSDVIKSIIQTLLRLRWKQ